MRINASALLMTVLGLAAVAPTFAEDVQLLNFELEDQFKAIHRRADVAGSIVLLIGSDKGGVKFNGAWGKAIHDSLGDHPHYDQITHLAHADLRGVPFFLKGFIRGKFPQEPHRWVLMDWKGIFAKAYDFAPKSSNVLVFGPDTALVHHASGREPGGEALNGLVTALRELLDEAG